MNILLPVYAMPDAELIIDFIKRYKWPADTSFKAIHILGGMATDADFSQSERQAEELLAGVSRRLKNLLPSAPVSTAVSAGQPTLEIIAAASAWKADMIVMGYRTRSDIEGFLTGSVSKGVVMQAPCSVAIIKPSPFN